MIDTIKRIQRSLANDGEANRHTLIGDYVAARRQHDPTAEQLDDEAMIRDAIERPDDELSAGISAAREIEVLKAQCTPADQQTILDETAAAAAKSISGEVAAWEKRLIDLQTTENEATRAARIARRATVDAMSRIRRLKEQHSAMFGVSPKAAPASESFSVGLHGERLVAGPTIRHDEIAAGLM
jgi:hypothetical protein